MEFLTSITFWSFIAVALILYRLGETVKNVILGRTKKEIEESIKTPWKKLFYQTMMFHPVIGGAIMGLVLMPVVPEMIATAGKIGSVLYFAMAGVLSTWVFEIVKRALRRFNLGGASSSASEDDK